ncbi:MAG: hypothetical protein FJ403_09780 [Verrucomicrobia bacterium]|nr:hypothetical protein [Verrucomicrobiota bacterium]
MKTWVFIGLLVLGGRQAAAQGTVNFANGVAGVDAPFKLPQISDRAEVSAWEAELLLVSSDGSSKRIGESVALQSDALAGYFFGGSVAVPDVDIDARATFRVRVFDTTGSKEAFSNPVTVTLGGGKMPPPNLVGLTTWNVQAVNPQLTIAVFAQSVTLSWSKAFANAVVEYSDSLANANWTSTPETPQIGADNFRVTVPTTAVQRFYRLRLK